MLRTRSTTAVSQRAIDFACIVGGYFVAGQIALRLSESRLFEFPTTDPWEAQYAVVLALALLAWTGATSYCATYQSLQTESLQFASRALMRTLGLWALMTVASVFILKIPNVSRQFTAYLLFVSSILIAGARVARVLIERRLGRFGYRWRTAIVVGERQASEEFAYRLTSAHPTGYRVFVKTTDISADRGEGWPSSAQIDDIFIVGAEHTSGANIPMMEHVPRLLKRGKRVHIIPALMDVRLFHQSLGDVGGIPVISIMGGQLGSLQAAVKRFADMVMAAILLAVLSPLLTIIALAIRVTSDGPALFRQRRLGLKGNAFDLYKFRTMVTDAENVLAKSPALYEKYLSNNFKLPKGQDPRITRIGYFLRATSLDELPQLINVLFGHMSLVGPRPIVPLEVEKYGDAADLFLSVKPGMTGHWQVNGRSDVQAYDRRVELDLEYIRDQSLGKDFEILMRTVPAILRGKGAH